MKLRILIWASVGALVVVLWSVYMAATMPAPLGNLIILAYVTCPIALAHHQALGFTTVLLANAATYAVAGTAIETGRRYTNRPG